MELTAKRRLCYKTGYLNMEQRLNKTLEFNFNLDAFELEERIKGAHLRIGFFETRILKAEGFSRAENNQPRYQLVTRLKPGELVGVPYRGIVLPLVATKDGSCLLLHSLEIPRLNNMTERIKGSGNVSKVLELRRNEINQLDIEDTGIPILRLIRASS